MWHAFNGSVSAAKSSRRQASAESEVGGYSYEYPLQWGVLFPYRHPHPALWMPVGPPVIRPGGRKLSSGAQNKLCGGVPHLWRIGSQGRLQVWAICPHHKKVCYPQVAHRHASQCVSAIGGNCPQGEVYETKKQIRRPVRWRTTIHPIFMGAHGSRHDTIKVCYY